MESQCNLEALYQDISYNTSGVKIYPSQGSYLCKIKKKSLKILSETVSPSPQIFGMKYCLAYFYKDCSNAFPRIKIDSACGMSIVLHNFHRENLENLPV